MKEESEKVGLKLNIQKMNLEREHRHQPISGIYINHLVFLNGGWYNYAYYKYANFSSNVFKKFCFSREKKAFALVFAVNTALHYNIEFILSLIFFFSRSLLPWSSPLSGLIRLKDEDHCLEHLEMSWLPHKVVVSGYSDLLVFSSSIQ